MHVLRLLRIFIPLVLVAAIVAGDRRRAHVAQRAPAARATQVDDRVEAAAHRARHPLRARSTRPNDAVKSVPGPLHQIVDAGRGRVRRLAQPERHGGSVDVAGRRRQRPRVARPAARASLRRAAPRLAGQHRGARRRSTRSPRSTPPDRPPTRLRRPRSSQLRARAEPPARSVAARILGYELDPGLRRARDRRVRSRCGLSRRRAGARSA